MLFATAAASIALLSTAASASSLSVGSAYVINSCSYDVYLCNTPSADGGYEQQDVTLSSGDSWNQTWTELSNGNGWSIKLSKVADVFGSDIMQYEYTFQDDGIIWYDLSEVNGNPWDGNWEITADSASSSCDPKQQAYRYATDDAYGMQSCPQDSVITVTLCSGDDTSSYSSASSYSSTSSYSSEESSSTTSAAAYTTSQAQTTSATATPTTTAAAWSAFSWNDEGVVQDNANNAAYTTMATSVVTADSNDYVVTEIETAVVTAVVTEYAGRIKRHEHHAHAHAHHHA